MDRSLVIVNNFAWQVMEQNEIINKKNISENKNKSTICKKEKWVDLKCDELQHASRYI